MKGGGGKMGSGTVNLRDEAYWHHVCNLKEIDISKHVSGGFSVKLCNRRGYDRNKERAPVVWKSITRCSRQEPSSQYSDKRKRLGKYVNVKVETLDIY